MVHTDELESPRCGDAEREMGIGADREIVRGGVDDSHQDGLSTLPADRPGEDLDLIDGVHHDVADRQTGCAEHEFVGEDPVGVNRQAGRVHACRDHGAEFLAGTDVHGNVVRAHPFRDGVVAHDQRRVGDVHRWKAVPVQGAAPDRIGVGRGSRGWTRLCLAVGEQGQHNSGDRHRTFSFQPRTSCPGVHPPRWRCGHGEASRLAGS